MYQRKIFKREYTELTGCLHVHSKYSFDSETPIARIIKAAHQNQLDFLCMNDHLSDQAKFDQDFVSEQNIMMIPGFEINDQDNNNHLLVYGSDTVIKDKTANEYVAEYARENAITFAAHPFERRSSRKIRRYIWTDTDIDQFNGLEIWNALSNWVSKVRPNLNGMIWVLLAHNFIRRPSRTAIKWWDAMNLNGKRKAAIGSVDAHGFVFKRFGIKIPFLCHKFMFKTVRTNILLPQEWEQNTDNVLRSLAEGRSYIINYHRGIPYNFYAGISARDQIGVSFGEEIKFQEGLKFYYRLSKIAKVYLYCDGKRIDQQLDEKGSFEIKKPGNYRLEILLNRKGWIYTNNIYVIRGNNGKNRKNLS